MRPRWKGKEERGRVTNGASDSTPGSLGENHECSGTSYSGAVYMRPTVCSVLPSRSRGSSDKGHGWSPGTSPTLGGAALMGGGFGVSAIRAVRDRPGRAWEGETLGPPRTASTDALVGPAELPSDSDAKPSRMWALRAKAVAGRE